MLKEILARMVGAGRRREPPREEVEKIKEHLRPLSLTEVYQRNPNSLIKLLILEHEGNVTANRGYILTDEHGLPVNTIPIPEPPNPIIKAYITYLLGGGRVVDVTMLQESPRLVLVPGKRDTYFKKAVVNRLAEVMQSIMRIEGAPGEAYRKKTKT